MARLHWAGMAWPVSMDINQILDDWDTAVSMAAEYRDRQWIARNLGDVPMRIVDTWRPSVTTITPISTESLCRES